MRLSRALPLGLAVPSTWNFHPYSFTEVLKLQQRNAAKLCPTHTTTPSPHTYTPSVSSEKRGVSGVRWRTCRDVHDAIERGGASVAATCFFFSQLSVTVAQKRVQGKPARTGHYLIISTRKTDGLCNADDDEIRCMALIINISSLRARQQPQIFGMSGHTTRSISSSACRQTLKTDLIFIVRLTVRRKHTRVSLAQKTVS